MSRVQFGQKCIASCLFVMLFVVSVSGPLVAGEQAETEIPIIAEVVAPQADELIRKASEVLLEDIRQNKALYAENPSGLYERVRQEVLPHFDFPRISGYVLGNAWKQASKEVQQSFEQEFSTLMLRTYGSALLAFQDGRIEFSPVKAASDATMVTVKTRVHGKDGSITPIFYRMGKHTGQWKVLDIRVDGVSLIKTYRSEYGSIVKRQGIGELIAALVERNQRNL
ncbi:MAG: ABC transporter substrate-binding protein [Immundisolibacteraceae bacterium]|nr:ABC transporter substrate-binding protein [Immundisolibacteraceae bacterium]